MKAVRIYHENNEMLELIKEFSCEFIDIQEYISPEHKWILNFFGIKSRDKLCNYSARYETKEINFDTGRYRTQIEFEVSGEKYQFEIFDV